MYLHTLGFGNSQLTDDLCNPLSDELSDRGSPDYEFKMTELVGEHVNEGFDPSLGLPSELVIDLVPPESF
jgi:hypothetical protein